jgi:uncharacterized protein YkwD
MNFFVAVTTIMLSVLLSATGGIQDVSSSPPTQKLLLAPSVDIRRPQLAINIPATCAEPDPGFTTTRLKIDQELQVGSLTFENAPIETQHPNEPEQTVASIALENTQLPEISPQPAVPSPSAAQIQSVATPTPSAGSSGVLNADVLFSLVNQTRMNAGLPEFEKHPDICSIAWSRAPELDNEIYGSSYMHAGFHARDLPFWATENMISQQTETDALNWWLNSSVHRAAIFGDYKYACTACAGKSCNMIFSNLTPK